MNYLDQKFAEIGNHCVDLLKRGEYEIVDYNGTVCNIEIQGFYQLPLWVFNEAEDFGFWFHTRTESLQRFFGMSNEEQESAWLEFVPKLKKFELEKGRADKLRRIEELKGELEKLEKTA